MKNILFLLLIIIYNNNAQELSEEIIIQGPQPNEWLKSPPVIDIDSQGNIGIVWANNYTDHYTINFVRSTDGGNTFDSIRVVEDIPYHPDWGGWFIPAIVYDDFDNPLVFYYSYLAPFTDHYRLKKSLDGGNSFPAQYQYFNQSGGYTFGFMLSDLGVGYLALEEGRNIIVRKTYDYGNTFPDLTIINSGNFSIIGKVTIILCNNNDILCFWGGQDQTTHRNAIFYNRSTDNGNSFSSKIELDSTTQSPHGINAISLNNEIIITYNGRSDSTNYQLLYKKSYDYGITYSNINILHDYTTSPNTSSRQCKRFNTHVGLCINWNQTNHDRRILFSRSKNFGNSFDSTTTIAEGPRINEWESMAISDSGDVYIVSLKDDGNFNYSIILNKTKISTITNVESDNQNILNQFELLQNYPNPFNASTKISYQLHVPGFVSLSIYNLLGQIIDTIVIGKEFVGTHNLIWQSDDCTSGVYFYKLFLKTSTNKVYTKTKKLILLK